jgi:hypothetical protein
LFLALDEVFPPQLAHTEAFATSLGRAYDGLAAGS